MPAHVFGPGSFKLGETASRREIATQCTKLALTPSTNFEDDIPLLSGATIPGDATSTWIVSGTAQQDYELASLELYCYKNRLQDLPFLFTPNNKNAVSYSGVCTIVPLSVGGDVKKRNASDFEFRVIGDPIPVNSSGSPLVLT